MVRITLLGKKRVRILRWHWVQLLAFMFFGALLMLSASRALAAVTISVFGAQAQTTAIVVNWTTASELNNAGFNVYRGTASTGTFAKINTGIVPVKNPGSISGASYSFTDSSAEKGKTYYYKLESVEFNGTTQQFGPVSAAISAPTSTPTTVPPTATRTPTTAPPTATRTSTTAATATVVVQSADPTATASLTPLGTPAPTSTPFPTRIALFVDPAAPTATLPPAPAARPNNPAPPAPTVPASNPPAAAPTQESIAQDLATQDSLTAPDSTTADQPASDPAAAPTALPDPLMVAIILIGGVAAMVVLAVGAASFYLVARKFIH